MLRTMEELRVLGLKNMINWVEKCVNVKRVMATKSSPSYQANVGIAP